MAQDLDSLNTSVINPQLESTKFNLDWLLNMGVEWAISLGLAIGVLVIGFFISKRITKVVDKILHKKKLWIKYLTKQC